MNRTLLLLTILAGLIVSVFIYGCKREEIVNDLEEFNTKDLTLTEAKAFFERNFDSPSIDGRLLISSSGVRNQAYAFNNENNHQHTEDCEHNNVQKPMWDKFAYRTLTGGNQAVLAPIHKKNTYIKISDDRMVKFGFLNYIIMYKDSSGEIVTEWVELKPTLKWFDAKTVREYDGDIIIKDWEGKVKRIISYDDGQEIVFRSRRNRRSNTSGINSASGGRGDGYCITKQKLTYTPGTNCICENHTWAQRSECTCPTVQLNHSRNYPTAPKYTLETEIECWFPDDPDEPPVGGGSSIGGGSPPEGNNNGGGIHHLEIILRRIVLTVR